MKSARVVSRAPGKLVVLGEYAVLEGAPALVVAVDRYCRADITHAREPRCRLVSRAGAVRTVSFLAEESSGFAIVDEVARHLPGAPPWRGTLDSSELFQGGLKLGLGSSAAALTAWAGAWAPFSGEERLTADAPTLDRLIALHRGIQGGSGSGIDVAASLFGGVLRYQLDGRSPLPVSAVRLPNGVGFAGVFTRTSASTPDYLARYHAWRARVPRQAAEETERLGGIVEDGIAAASRDDVDGFLGAVSRYSRRLDRLGERAGIDIVTREHRQIRERAERLGMAYKVSGAGGGDLGLAFGDDAGKLEAFKRAVEGEYDVVELGIDEGGLVVETIEP